MIDFKSKLKTINPDELMDDDEFSLDELEFSDNIDVTLGEAKKVLGEINQEGESLEQKEVELIIPKCEFLTGGAGTGKTYEIKRRMQEYHEKYPNIDRNYGVLAATTGIAAINLGDDTSTVNSVLAFFDTDSLEDAFNSGKLQKSLKIVAHKADFLIIDEVSMMPAKQLDIIWDALLEINQHSEIIERGGLGIILTGDFCQLPPVPDKDHKTGKPLEVKYCFEAQCWSHFQQNTTTLTKNWRQNDLQFVTALNYARKGDGVNCAAILKEHKGVSWNEEIETNFDGTTIFSKNVEVDRLNQTRLRNLLHSKKKPFTVKSFRWGKQRGEWKNIPENLELCESSYVMILANDSKLNGFRYANGTTGYIMKYTPKLETQIEVVENNTIIDEEGTIVELGTQGTPNTFLITFKSNNNVTVEIGKICRQVTSKQHPNDLSKPEYQSLKEWKEDSSNDEKYATSKQAKFIYETQYLSKLTEENKKASHKLKVKDYDKWWCTCQSYFLSEQEYLEHKQKSSPEVFFDYQNSRWVIGEIYYYPLRLAYASTVHKSQGLTLDKVQIDFINKFFSQPSMGYVALSRCRTAEGLRLVGSPKLLEDRINISRKVLKFI